MLNVFTSADRGYHPFVLPYIASVLTHNANTVVELIVEDAEGFKTENQEALSILNDAFDSSAFILRDGDFQKVGSHAIRFVEEPSLKPDYVYIGDIDVLVLENISSLHLKQMAKTGLPYSNFYRKDAPRRLTGLHFTEYSAHYPLPVVPVPTGPGWDELLLTRQVESRGHSLDKSEGCARPLHGLHLSLRRAPFGPVSWAVDVSHVAPYKKLAKSELWRLLLPLLHPNYKRVLFLLETALTGRFPEEMKDHNSLFRAYCLWDGWAG